MGQARARRTDPMSSHGAARDLFDTGIQGKQQLAASRLVQQHPGQSYLRLYEIHAQDSNRPGGELVFKNAVALMRRLSEVARRGDPAYCRIADRKVLTWWPQ